MSIIQITWVYPLKTLITLFVNLIVPGAGFISTGFYRIGIGTQLFLALIIISFSFARWIIIPTGIYVLLILISLVYLIGTIYLIISLAQNRPYWCVKNTFLTIAFVIICLTAFSISFMTKDRWLGIHINFVPSGSMHPTLQPGDFILVDHWYYDNNPIALNDVVVFKLPRHQELSVKRVKEWPESGLERNDKFYLLGDNTQHSHDSRSFGGIESEWIQGKVVMILVSFDSGWKLRNQRVFIRIY